MPMGQYSHSVFNEKETMPASHRVQLAAFAAAQEPAGQVEQATEPVAANLPAGH